MIDVMRMRAAPAGLFLDANLLVLFVAGRVSTAIIARHRRLSEYDAADYAALAALLARADRILVTPNTLTEASNLLRQHREPERSLLMARLRYLIEESEEIVVASAAAATNPSFTALGLTDAVLLEAVNAETPLLTADLELYLAAIAQDESAALNFREFRAHRPY